MAIQLTKDAQFIFDCDISELENLLLDTETNHIKVVSAKDVKQFDREQISMFCWRYGLYQIPTIELIEFLKTEISGKKTIEIAAGNGAIGRALNIPITDNRVQEKKGFVRDMLLKARQYPVNYGKDVEELDGFAAVTKYKPEIVLASWLTGKDLGNIYGVNENQILQKPYVKKYIHIGNKKVHATKRIIQPEARNRNKILKRYDYREIQADWLVTRSLSQELNFIFIFEEKQN